MGHCTQGTSLLEAPVIAFILSKSLPCMAAGHRLYRCCSTAVFIATSSKPTLLLLEAELCSQEYVESHVKLQDQIMLDHG